MGNTTRINREREKIMKKNLRIEKVLSSILIALLIFTTKIYAATDYYETTIKATPEQLKEGERVEITLGLDKMKIESGEGGIAGYTAKFIFDSDVFEYVSSKGTEKWEAPFYQGGTITAHTTDGEVTKTNQSIGSITLQVKKGAKLGKTNITLENFSGATMGATEVKASNQATEVTIISSNQGNGGNGENQVNNITNTNTTNTVEQGNTNQVNNNHTNEAGQGINQNNNHNVANTKPGKLPQTGDNLSVVLTVIGIGTVVAISLYIRTRMISPKK